MSEEPFKAVKVLSSETATIKKLANFISVTAKTKNYGQILLNTKSHSDPLKTILQKIFNRVNFSQFANKPEVKVSGPVIGCYVNKAYVTSFKSWPSLMVIGHFL